MRITLIYFLLIFNETLIAQSHIAALPKIGDYNYSSLHTQRVEPFQLEPNENKNYDYNFLVSYWSIKEPYMNPKTSKYSKYFPYADLVLYKANETEEFFDINDGSLLIIGHVKNVPYSSSKEIVNYISGNKLANFNKKVSSTYTNNYSYRVKIANQNLINGYDFIGAFDSLLVEANVKENFIVLEESTLILNNQPRKVQKHFAIGNYIIKVKVKNKRDKDWTWQQNYDTNILPESIKDIIGNQKITKTTFISTAFKGITLTYNNVENIVKEIHYQDTEPSPQMKSLTNEQFDVLVSPNPTFGNITLNLFNYPFDNYTFELYNIVGKKVFTKSFNRRDGYQLKTDISQMKKGTYMFSVLDSRGRKMTTKRISLIGI